MLLSQFEFENKINQSSLLVFDFDGVLVDSVEIKTDAFVQLYRPYGDEIVNQVVTHHRDNGGMSRFDKFKYYHQEFLGKDIDEIQIRDMASQFSELVFDMVVASQSIVGASSFLHYYCRDRKVCTINSATPQQEIRKIVKARAIDKLFSTVLGSPKSKSSNLNKILRGHHCKPKDALFFGDAVSDLDAAEENDVAFVGIGAGLYDLLSNRSGEYFYMEDFSSVPGDLC